MKLSAVLPCMFVLACDSTPVPLPDPSTGASSSIGSGGSGTGGGASSSGTGGTGGAGGAGGGTASSSGVGGSVGSGGASMGNGGMSGTRLRRRLVTSADGLSVVVPGAFYDSVIGVVCNQITTPQGVRCMSLNLASSYFFSDATCTTGVLVMPKGCSPPAYSLLSETTQGQCGATILYRGFVTGPKLPTAYQKSGLNCVEWQPSNNTTSDVYGLGVEVTYASFAELTTETE